MLHTFMKWFKKRKQNFDENQEQNTKTPYHLKFLQEMAEREVVNLERALSLEEKHKDYFTLLKLEKKYKKRPKKLEKMKKKYGLDDSLKKTSTVKIKGVQSERQRSNTNTSKI